MDFDDRPEPAKRLEQARLAAGYETMKDACRAHRWKYVTYQQHETGIRGIGRAVEKYARAYRTTQSWLQFGEGTPPTPRKRASQSIDKLIEDAPADVREAVIDFIENLTKKAS